MRNAIIRKVNNPCNKCGELINLENMAHNRRCCRKCHHKQINKKSQAELIIKQQQQQQQITKPERTLIIGASACGKTTLMLDILKRFNPENVYIISRTENQYPLKYYNQSTEIEILNFYENSSVVFDDMLGTKQARDIDQFFCRGRHNNINIYYLSQSWYSLPKNTIRNNSSVLCIVSQTKADMQSLHRDVAGLDMSYQDWLELCREAWSKPHNYIQINRCEPIQNRYSIRNVNTNKIIICIPTTKPF